MTFHDSPALRSSRLVIVFADLAGYARGFRDHSDEEMARFLDRYYHACFELFEARGGRVVKLIGDSCLVVFPERDGSAAAEALIELERRVSSLADEHDLDVILGANVHCGSVMEGLYGPTDRARYDIIGSAVNHAALMGRGPGLRLSEPVYRQLPSGDRSPWQKVKPPAVYHHRAG
ncbi:MAG: adenylate/guanylate cyclase domain-containing protein [Acidobacteriota bacterium]